jgi:hypothetical protein
MNPALALCDPAELVQEHRFADTPKALKKQAALEPPEREPLHRYGHRLKLLIATDQQRRTTAGTRRERIPDPVHRDKSIAVCGLFN